MSEKRAKPGRPRKDETVMKMLTRCIVVPLDEDNRPTPSKNKLDTVNNAIGCLTGSEVKPQEKIKKRKRGRPRKNIKFIPLSSSRGIVYQEEGEEDPQDMFLGKRNEDVESSGESEDPQN